MGEKHWYIVQAYSNFERKVADSIREQAKQRHLDHLFDEVMVPTEKVVEVHGSDAASYAVTRAALLRNLGDAMGATAWLRVAPVIEELQRASKLNRRAGASIKGRAPHR